MSGHDHNDVSSEESTQSLKRRSVLSNIATGVVASTAFSNPATATEKINQETKDRLKSVAAEYPDSDAVLEAIDTHANDILEKLSNRGLIETKSVDGLPLENRLSMDEFAETKEGTLVVGVLSGDTPTARIMIKKTLNTRELTIIVEPHVAQSFATVSQKGAPATETEFIGTNASTSSCTCYQGDACIVTCHTSDGCSCANYDVECCPDCCECNIGSLTTGGCSNCYSDCWAAASCSCN